MPPTVNQFINCILLEAIEQARQWSGSPVRKINDPVTRFMQVIRHPHISRVLRNIHTDIFSDNSPILEKLKKAILTEPRGLSRNMIPQASGQGTPSYAEESKSWSTCIDCLSNYVRNEVSLDWFDPYQNDPNARPWTEVVAASILGAIEKNPEWLSFQAPGLRSGLPAEGLDRAKAQALFSEFTQELKKIRGFGFITEERWKEDIRKNGPNRVFKDYEHMVNECYFNVAGSKDLLALHLPETASLDPRFIREDLDKLLPRYSKAFVFSSDLTIAAGQHRLDQFLDKITEAFITCIERARHRASVLTERPEQKTQVPSRSIQKRESTGILFDGISNWEDIEIVFTSEERVQINIKGRPLETRTYAEMGFEDRRNERPNRLWSTLRRLAEEDGIIKLPGNQSQKPPMGQTTKGHHASLEREYLGRRESANAQWTKVEKRIQEIRKVLRDLFTMTDDPLPFIKGTGYTAKFGIRCSRAHTA